MDSGITTLILKICKFLSYQFYYQQFEKLKKVLREKINGRPISRANIKSILDTFDNTNKR